LQLALLFKGDHYSAKDNKKVKAKKLKKELGKNGYRLEVKKKTFFILTKKKTRDLVKYFSKFSMG
jgi:hypothetical protein